MIALHYLKTWFITDFIAIVPFTYILRGFSNDKLVRIARILKLVRMLRIVKVIKERKNIAQFIRKFVSFSNTFEILFFFSLTFFMLLHTFSCFWIFLSRIS